MSRQSKTRRRLFVVLMAAVAAAALGGGAALLRLHTIQQRALRGREDGINAMAQGDYATALQNLGKYLSRHPDDAEVLVQYAKAREMVEEPNGRHLGQAIALFQRVLALRPGLLEAQQHLFDLYIQVGYNTEAVNLADTVLAQSPDNPDALHARTIALLRMQRFDDAEASVKRLTAAAPLDLEFRVLELQVLQKKNVPGRITEYADRLAKEHPDDVRFELLRSIAAALAGDNKAAATLVQPLTTRPQPDAKYTRLLIRHLDGLQRFNESFAVLEQAAKGNPERDIAQMWFRRLFETNRLALLVDQTASLDPAARTSDVETLAMRTLALARLDRRPEAQQILAALDKRGATEPPAKRWAAVLRVSALRESSDPIQSIQLLTDALISGPGNPILLEELAEAFSAAGVQDKATETWSQVARVEPGWAAPLVHLSQSLLASGRVSDAAAAARAAESRAPQDYDVRVSVTLATAAASADPAAESDKLLAMIADVQRQFPKDVQLLPLKVAVHARAKHPDEAVKVIQAALASDPLPPQNILIVLAQTSFALELGQEEACFAACQKAYGPTPELVLAQALWMKAQKHDPESLAFFEKARSAHPADDISWRGAWAGYLDTIGDDRAKAEWLALGDGHPTEVKLQWSALNARSVQADHEFMGRTIDRLEKLIGEDSMSLGLIRARWLLQGEATENDASKASIILGRIIRAMPEMPGPRLLLANCYMKLGNVNNAVEQLTAVSDAQPELASVAIDLARLLHSRGDFAKARQYLNRAAGSKRASLDDLRQVASLMSLEGDYASALALLEKAYAAAGNQSPDIVLAALYQQLNQPQKTDDICRKLLEKPTVESVVFAADFYAIQNRPADAQKTLALLDGLKLPAGAKELILANHAMQHGSRDDVLRQLQASTKAAPKEAVVWRQLAVYCVSLGKIDDAIAAADAAAKNVAGPTGCEILLKNAPLAREAAPIEGTLPLLMALVGDPASEAPLLDALHILVDARSQKEPPARTATKFRQLADQNPRLLPLQTLTIQLYMNSGQTDEAVAMSTRTVQSFPAAIEPLRVASNVFGAARRWDQQLNAAREWRRLGASDTLGADLAIAGAQLQTGDLSAASQQIQPYLESALQDPEKYRGVILLRAQGLLLSHQPEQAEALLSPLLSKAPQWRSLWLSLAVRGTEDAQRGQAWVEQVAPQMTGTLAEKSLLAQAWMALGTRWNNPDFTQTGTKMLESVVQAPDPPLQALMIWGQTCEKSTDWAGAERAYRQVLARDAAAAIPMNNLAYVLVQSRKNLDEALKLVARAVELNPAQPAFFDTRALVQAALKDYPGAVASLKEAERLDPKNLDWRINLLQILLDSGQIPAAKDELQQITTLLPATPNLSPDTRQRLDALRAKLQP